MDTANISKKSESQQEEGGKKEMAENEKKELALGILEDEELFMTVTQEDHDTWQQRMDQNEDTLKARKETFDKWQDDLVRRRMFAYTRMKKLQNCFRQRLTFYSDVNKLIDAMVKKVDSDGDKMALATPFPDIAGADDSSKDPQLQQQEQQEQQQQQEHQQQDQEHQQKDSNQQMEEQEWQRECLRQRDREEDVEHAS